MKLAKFSGAVSIGSMVLNSGLNIVVFEVSTTASQLQILSYRPHILTIKSFAAKPQPQFKTMIGRILTNYLLLSKGLVSQTPEYGSQTVGLLED